MRQRRSGFRLASMTLIVMLVVSFAIIARRPGSANQWEFPETWFFHDSEEQRQSHASLLGEKMPTLGILKASNGSTFSSKILAKYWLSIFGRHGADLALHRFLTTTIYTQDIKIAELR